MGRSDRVIAFIENLVITSGSLVGEPFILREWQRDIVRRTYDPAYEDGRRKVRTSLVTIPRKNGKTQLAAGLCLAHLLGPESEPRGQIYSAAADRAQAALIYAECVAMIQSDPELEAMVNIVETTKRIVHYPTGSFYQAISSEHRSKHGYNASVIVYDELAQAPNRKLFEVLTTSTAARREPLTMVISTQSGDPNHVMSELVDYGRKVLDGTIEDETFAATLYIAPDDADPWDEKVWFACNPALDDFRSLEEMRTYAAQAKRLPARENTFRSLYLNQATGDEERFINAIDWEACTGVVDREALEGETCFAGLDLSATRDLTALVLWFPDTGAVLPFFWLPGDTLADREDADRMPYRRWKKDGYLNAPHGRAVDKMAVAIELKRLSVEFDIQAIAYDRWRIEELNLALVKEGLDELPLVPFGQGYKDMGPATDLLENAILDGTLQHGGHPVLTMCASNAAVMIDPTGAKKLAKQKSIGRIDGLVALAMAIGVGSRTEIAGPSLYDQLAVLEGDDAAGAEAASPLTADIDYQALNDPSHPLFAVMAARFEAQRGDSFDDD